MSESIPDPEVTGMEVAKLYRESRERVLDQLASANLKIDELRELLGICDMMHAHKDALIVELTEAVKGLHSNPWRSYKALVERAEKEVTKE